MIVQQVRPGAADIIIRNVDHAPVAGELARAFGNRQFLRPGVADLLTFVAEHHEEGWRSIDNAPLRNPQTGLPYHLGDTPADLLVEKSHASPAFNERFHPLCGLLSSMHATGLYKGRYGVSDAVSIDQRPAGYGDLIERMLAAEEARQAGLKKNLRRYGLEVWAEPKALLSLYKLLEFFDTLALWFQLTAPELRRPAYFRSVPISVGEDVILLIEPTGPHGAKLSPWPFMRPVLRLSCVVRPIWPSVSDESFGRALDEAQPFLQHYELVAH